MDYIWSTFIQAKKFNGGRTLIKLEYIQSTLKSKS